MEGERPKRSIIMVSITVFINCMAGIILWYQGLPFILHSTSDDFLLTTQRCYKPIQVSALDFAAHYGNDLFEINTFKCHQRSVLRLCSVSAHPTSQEMRFHSCSLYNYFTVSCLGFSSLVTHISVIGSLQAGFWAHLSSHSISSEVRRPRRKADHSLRSSAKIKNESHCISIPPRALTGYSRTDSNFTFLPLFCFCNGNAHRCANNIVMPGVLCVTVSGPLNGFAQNFGPGVLTKIFRRILIFG